MKRLTIKKAGSILVKDLSGGYQSPCFGCENINGCVSGKIQPCAIYRALEKLKEYEDLEEQGKLLKLPCAVGDTVYIKSSDCDLDYTEAEVRDLTRFTSCGFCIVIASEKFNQRSIPFSEFGKTVFLTREEVEETLQKMKETEVG